MAKRETKRAVAAKKKNAPHRYRVPNPPALFAGREDERRWFVEALERASIVVVSGPGGVGKTALVRYAIHKSFPRKLARTLNLQVPPAEPASQVLLQIHRAITEAEGSDELDWSDLQGDLETAMVKALERAEAGSYWIVLDDLYQEEIEEADKLLLHVASYAQRSRWIVTSRRTPTLHQLAGQVWTLGALSERTLQQLAHAWAPTVAEVHLRTAVSRAAGSPWMLYQLLSSPIAPQSADDATLLSGLSPEALSFVRSLSVFDAPLPSELLMKLFATPSPQDLESLRRRGLIDDGPGGVRLHDIARGMIRAEGRDPRFEAEVHRVADVLLTLGDPEALLEGSRLLVELHRASDLKSVVESQGETLLGLGYAPRLWKVLRGTESQELEGWRLRCAAELGNPTALAQVRAPHQQGPSERLAWARTLLAEGDPDGAHDELQTLLASDAFAGAPQHAAEAVLLIGEALRLTGRWSDASAALQSLDVEGHLRLRRDAAIALCAIMVARPSTVDMQTLVRSALDHATDADLAALVAEALVASGRIDEASRVLDAARGTPRGAHARLLSTRRLILTAARIAGMRGHIEESKALLEQVRPYAHGASLLLPSLYLVDAECRLALGELAELVSTLESWQAEVRSMDAHAEAELTTARVRLAVLLALEELPKEPDPSEGTLLVQQHLAWRRMHHARVQGAEELEPQRRSRRQERGPSPQITILNNMVAATEALVSGDNPFANARAVAAEREAERWDMGSLRAEALCLVADALVCASRLDELASTAELLGHLSSRLASPRHLEEGRFYAAVAEGRMDPALLELLAACHAVAPVAARRAQALLGGEPRLDHLDLRVLEALAGADVVQTIEVIVTAAQGEQEDWQPGWGVDAERTRVWLEDGSIVDLSGQALSMRILETLLAHHGEASKEQLVLQAWGEPSYHPLRHDAKVHVAVRKARDILARGSKHASERIVTSEAGYRLAGPVRWAR